MQFRTPSDAARIIKTARLQKQLTQGALAEQVGITRQSLVRIEQGSGATSLDTYLRIFEVLGVRLSTTTVSTSSSGGEEPGRRTSDRTLPLQHLRDLNLHSGAATQVTPKSRRDLRFEATLEALRRKVAATDPDLPGAQELQPKTSEQKQS